MNKKMLNTISVGLDCLLGGLYLGKGIITKNNWDLGWGLSWLAIGAIDAALSVKSFKKKQKIDKLMFSVDLNNPPEDL